MSEKFLDVQLNRAVWVALLEQKKIVEAIEKFEIYIQDLKQKATDKDFADKIKEEIAYSNSLVVTKLSALSKEYFDNKDFCNALICHKEILGIDAENIENIKNYIKCLEELKQFDIVIELYKYLLKIDDNYENYKSLSDTYSKNKKHKEALKTYYQYLKLKDITDLNDGQNNSLGCLYFNYYNEESKKQKTIERSLRYFIKAVRQNSNNKVYLRNVISAATRAKRDDIAKKYWDKYFSLGYTNIEDEFAYSAFCISTGDFENWGKYYNRRFQRENPGLYPKTDKPEWTGNEDLSDKTLLVHFEQGFGDTILTFGYVPRLVKMAKRVIFVVQDLLYPLLCMNKYGVQIIRQSDALDLSKFHFDYFIPSMTLISALKLDKTNISVGEGYINPNNELVEKFKKKYFNTDKLKVGIAFASKGMKERDIPLEQLVKIDELKDVEFYCLSKDITDKQLSVFKNNKVVNIAKKCNDFADTAAAIANTDIVVSTDNCILNLAGAIGKETLGLFNYHFEFRWYDLTKEDVGYYTSVKPIINKEFDDWSESVNKVISYINNKK